MNIRTALSTLALLVPVAAPLPALAQSVEEDEREKYAEACAVFYFQATRSRQAPEIVANFRQIDQQVRWDILIQSFGLNQDDVVAEAMFGFGPVGAVMVNDKLDSGDQADQALAVSVLSDCDHLYGFTPVFAFGVADATADALTSSGPKASSTRTWRA